MAEWISTEYTKHYDNGARIRIRGWKCSSCGFFRHIKHGKSKFCEDCGERMKGEEYGE